MSPPTCDKKRLDDLAGETGFQRDALEKTMRLAAVLGRVSGHRLLSKALALNGGAAVNLALLDLPRLCGALDFDYAVDDGPLDPSADRKRISAELCLLMEPDGYAPSVRSRSGRLVDSLVFLYISSGGLRDSLKIDVDYSNRRRVLPMETIPLRTAGLFPEAEFLSAAPLEIFASRIVSLLVRAAPGDLYDVVGLIRSGRFGRAGGDGLRRCVAFHLARAGVKNAAAADFRRADKIGRRDVSFNLSRMLRKKENFDLGAAKTQAKEYLAGLLAWTEDEAQFFDDYQNGVYRPELLFSGEQLERVRRRPADWG
ncbi:MAG: nucleotidyl transferase AbiEii/AbiGii toxin family protein [Deltaproteobacteria bacterium]|nr:nucleotidyl transferase AbiEii/AbiGii toxin family protein [Deltaproteobacteria bacterium]